MPAELSLSIMTLFDARPIPWVGAPHGDPAFVPRSYALWAFLVLATSLGIFKCLHA